MLVMLAASIQFQELIRLVPEHREEEIAIPAAWHYKKGRLSLEKAAEIAGMSETQFEEFCAGREKHKHWADTAKDLYEAALMKRHIEEGEKNFAVWASRITGYNADYINRIVGLYRRFEGSPILALPLSRLERVTYLTNRAITRLASGKMIRLKGHYYNLKMLLEMDNRQYINLLYIPT